VHVTVKLFAHFRDGRFKEEQREYPEGADCRHVLGTLGLGDRELGILMVNNRHARLEHPLTHGDTLSLFPLVGGG